jgi:hypothetical protein
MSFLLTHTDRTVPAPLSARPAFSALQLLHANHIGNITEKNRAHRPRTPTHPIDNIEAHVVSDRDDGIYVETQARKGGGYRIYVTIADVAGHVRLNSALAQTAIARGFTVYGPGWTDPMFPKNLEEKLSLEDQQERLGFAVSIDLDARFKPQHVEFQPVIAQAESMSYAQAAERMESDPQIIQMAQIAAGVRKNYFGESGNTALLHDAFSGYEPYASSSDLISATEMVATYMLLTNSCMAEFFIKSGVPYLYRNFDGTDDNARAYYHTHNHGHDALRQDKGLHGAYGHFTSPIRRAPDFLNAHVAHFAFGTLLAAEEHVLWRCPEIDRSALHKAIWSHGAELLQVCSDHPDIQTASRHTKQAKHIALRFLQTDVGLDPSRSQRVAKTLVAELAQLKPPITSAEMDDYAAQLNILAHIPETRAIKKLAQDYADLENLDKTFLATMEKKAFSAVMRRAASLGYIPRPIYNEALLRITEGRDETAQDGFSILMLASYPDVPRWNMLKRAVLRRIKHDPEAVNAIILSSHAFFGENVLQEKRSRLSDNTDYTALDHEPLDIHTRILTLQQEGQTVSVAAPFYSVGHDVRAAISHARYAFLEHFAFGELQPFNQTSHPNALYAELETGNKSRRELVEQMVSQSGGKLTLRSSTTDLGQHFEINVAGGEFPTPIFVEVNAETPEAAEQAAFRRLLRDPRFKHAVAPVSQFAAIMNPQHVLAEIAQEQGYLLEFSEVQSSPKGGFLATISITIDDVTHTFSEPGPNKDRALRIATATTLKALGKSLEDQGDSQISVRSWAMESNDENASSFMPGRPPRKKPLSRHLVLEKR